MVTKFYPPESNPPIYDLVKRCQPDFDFSAFPIIIFCDSSWQDCVDTGRSTGAYHIYVNGSLVKSTTFVPIPIAHSSAEAEYNACAFALTDAIYVKQAWNFMNGCHLDTPITFVLFTDSKSAKTMIECNHVTNTQDTLTDMYILTNKQECKACFKFSRYQERLILPM